MITMSGLEEFYNIKAVEIMNPIWNSLYVPSNARWDEVILLTSLHTHVWVVNDLKNMELIGIITEHDLLQIMSPEMKERFFGVRKKAVFDKGNTAYDVMTHNPITCRCEDNVKDVLKKMMTFNVRNLPVVCDENKFLGEVSIQTLLKNFKHRFM